MALGNSVVPDVVRAAFHQLATPPPILRPWRAVATAASTAPMCGWWATTSAHILRWSLPRHFLRRKRDYGLVFDPTLFAPDDVDPVAAAKVVDGPRSAARFSTPRHSMVTAGRYLSARNMCDLPTQVRFERSTPNALRAGQVTAEFVEYMMGYPIGWTSVAPAAPAAAKKTAGRPPARRRAPV